MKTNLGNQRRIAALGGLLVQASVLSLGWVSAATAHEADEPTDRAPDDDIVVTGTRAEDRTRLDASSPVDVLKFDRLSPTGPPPITSTSTSPKATPLTVICILVNKSLLK